MTIARLLISNSSRHMVRLVPTRIVHVPDSRVLRHVPLTITLSSFRVFSSTNSLGRSKSAKETEEEEQDRVEAPKIRQDDAPSRRALDNNNPQPVVTLPGGIAWPFTGSNAMDAAITTFIGLGLVFLGGVAYVAWYKKRVLDKMEQAFAKGYDPALELAGHVPSSPDTHDATSYAEVEHLRRREQAKVDAIIGGQETGHYFLLMGPKGTGKGTMLLEAMKAVEAEGVSICEAHPDLEVFRLRLGKALNFEYNEDTQTGLFQRRDPREGGPALDIERAFNKLEKVALRCHKKNGKPLVLIFNNVHLFPNDDAGKNMLLQIQQRAEAWGESGIMTVVFTSDDFWPYLTLRKNGNRMQVVSVADLDATASAFALRKMRKKMPNKELDTPEAFSEALSTVGGRLSFISKISRSKNMVKAADQMLTEEKSWLLSQIGLIKDCDDDVMDEQKWASCSWLLLEAFVKIRQEQEKELQERLESGEVLSKDASLQLPVIPYHKCRSIMTRTDFIEGLDRLNIIAIDIHLGVRPDSMLILEAARSVVEEDGFDDLLQGVRDRIDEIESLHRTAEVTFKDFEQGALAGLLFNKKGAKQRDTAWPT